MKEMSKVLAAAMIAGTLAACTSKPAETPAPAEETPAAAETAPAETAAAAQEDGQNPVMNVIGDYQADRCSVHVEAEGKDGVKFTVHWGSSATEASEWTMSGTFDAETTSVYYQDCVKVDRTYDDKGEVVTEGEVYTGGHGTFTFDFEKNTMTWTDDQEKVADGMTFELVPAQAN